MKCVVVEGCDGSGKSTLIANLRRECKRHFLVLHRANPPEDIDQIIGAFDILSGAAYSSVRVVCDRHPSISEPIYGLALRDKNLLDSFYTPATLALMMRDTVDRIIYCRPPISQIVEGLDKTPQLAGVRDRLFTIIDMYDRVMYQARSDWDIPILRYDWTEGPRLSFESLFFGELK